MKTILLNTDVEIEIAKSVFELIKVILRNT